MLDGEINPTEYKEMKIKLEADLAMPQRRGF